MAPGERVADFCRYGCCKATDERVGAGYQDEVPPAPRSKALTRWNDACGICRRRELIMIARSMLRCAGSASRQGGRQHRQCSESCRIGDVEAAGQSSQIMAHQACKCRLQCSASPGCAQQALSPSHSPNDPRSETRRPPDELMCLSDNIGVADSGEVMRCRTHPDSIKQAKRIAVLDADLGPTSNRDLGRHEPEKVTNQATGCPNDLGPQPNHDMISPELRKTPGRQGKAALKADRTFG